MTKSLGHSPASAGATTQRAGVRRGRESVGHERVAARPAEGGRRALRLKRAYDPPTRSDGRRILVDRLWPRGLSTEKAALDGWMTDVAPSTKLRRWFEHDAEKWPEFQRRYKQELRGRDDLVRELAELASRGPLTLVFGARDAARNDAVVLAAVIRARMQRATAPPHGEESR